MSERPMKTPPRRPPGFGDRQAPLPDGVVERTPIEPSEPSPSASTGDRPALEIARTRRTATRSTEPKTPSTDVPRDPYAGAATRQVNMRLLEPLHARYMQLVRDLDDAGYRTSLTEVTHALLDAGPTHPDEVRQLVRAWRRRREP